MNKKFKIPPNLNGMPLDKALMCLLPEGTSRRELRRTLDRGGVLCNGSRVRKAGQLVYTGNQVELDWAEETIKKSKLKTKPQIIFSEKELLVINKPAGISSEDLDLGYLCHRLDKETSGILLIAKDKETCHLIMSQFKNRTIEKIYHAKVWGKPRLEEFEIKSYLSSIDDKTGKVSTVTSGGKWAHTKFKLLSNSDPFSIIECYPLTGRSHQIRVHLSEAGLPIFGDKRYDPEYLKRELSDSLRIEERKRHLLHAYSISFDFEGKRLTLNSKFL